MERVKVVLWYFHDNDSTCARRQYSHHHGGGQHFAELWRAAAGGCLRDTVRTYKTDDFVGTKQLLTFGPAEQTVGNCRHDVGRLLSNLWERRAEEQGTRT